jgi:hypothetical protein
MFYSLKQRKQLAFLLSILDWSCGDLIDILSKKRAKNLNENFILLLTGGSLGKFTFFTYQYRWKTIASNDFVSNILLCEEH